MYIYTYIYMYIYIYIYMCVSIHTSIRIDANTCMYIQTFTYIHIDQYVYILECMQRSHSQIITRIHTYAYTRKPIQADGQIQHGHVLPALPQCASCSHALGLVRKGQVRGWLCDS